MHFNGLYLLFFLRERTKTMVDSGFNFMELSERQINSYDDLFYSSDKQSFTHQPFSLSQKMQPVFLQRNWKA